MKLNGETARRLAAIALGIAILVPVTLAAAQLRPAGGAPGSFPAGSCFGETATISGTSKAETLRGTPGRDVIVGRAGADRVLGRGGSDRICAGAGPDAVRGGGGRDLCDGGAGRDVLTGCEISAGTDRPGTRRANGGPAAADLALGTDEDTAAVIDLLAGASDPDGDPLEAGLSKYPAGGDLRLVDSRSAAFDPRGEFDRLRPGESARATFGYSVADPHRSGAEATVVVTVDGVEDPPAAAPDSIGVRLGAPATSIPVLANDSDRDGGPLAIVSATQPGHGTVVVAPGGGGLTYEPHPGHCGGVPDHFTYSVNGGSSASVTVTVDCPGALAVDDSAVLAEDAPATAIDVLANDSDPDGGALLVQSSTQPAHGTVVVGDGGTGLTYEPDPDYCDVVTDQFAYTLAGGATATVVVLVDCTDDAPRALDDSATIDEDAGPTAIDVLANDADVDGGPLSIESATAPAHGAVAITAGGSGLTYAPDPDYCDPEGDPDSFEYLLNGGSAAEVAVVTECVNQVVANPALFPAFDADVSDYIVRCDGKPVIVDVETKAGDTVSVDGGAPASGVFHASVEVGENQAFELTVDEGDVERSHHVRCVPADFPTWTYERSAPARHPFYLVAPTLQGGPPYAVVFNADGAPVWWYRGAPSLNDASFLPDGRLVWWREAATPSEDAYEVRELDGTLVRTFRTVTGIVDWHDFQKTPDGNYLLISHQPREHVNLAEHGGGENETVIDSVIEELSPTGQLLWSWSTVGHISLDEPGRWWPTILAGNNPVRITHLNAVEPSGDEAMLISLRHTDAVYKVDKATGQVLWKLGGTKTPLSLTIVGDPHGDQPLGGPHDVRQLADGTITIHDNRSGLGQAPRSVRYEIDEAARTATLLEEVKDPLAPSSNCCGSFAPLSRQIVADELGRPLAGDRVRRLRRPHVHARLRRGGDHLPCRSGARRRAQRGPAAVGDERHAPALSR